MTRGCAFLTMEDSTGHVVDDGLASAPLRDLGWEVESVPWSRQGVAWEGFDLVVVRSTWDYHHRPEAFLEVLEGIARTGARLENPLPLIRWNIHKSYLRDLAESGVPTVPTLWSERLSPGDLRALFDEIPGDEIVLKPVVGASAGGAYRLDRRADGMRAGEVEAFFSGRPFLAQPFARSVLSEGEYSLFYFNGRHSHTILKTPKAGDFRVQEEHGGTLRAVEAGEGLRQVGAKALAALHESPLYARADFVRSNVNDEWWLMELELIEPSLYLRMDPEAPRRFARAIDERSRD